MYEVILVFLSYRGRKGDEERDRVEWTDGRLHDCTVTPCRWWVELQAGPSVTQRHGNSAADLFSVGDCEVRSRKCLRLFSTFSHE